jgi:hypothetical protein
MQDIIDGMDPSKAALAFEEMSPLLRTQTESRRANTDINKAVVVAASVGRMVKQPEMRAEFAALPATRFDVQHVDRLESAALATWHASLALRNATALTSGAKIPDTVVAEATDLKQTMMKVLDYYLGQSTDVYNILADIRGGTGYVDLASDLARLAELYQIHAPVLAVDTVRYKATDREDAGRLAQAIHQVLGDGQHSDARYWTDYLARAWSLLVITYDEVSATGRWLFRHEDGETRFPSLYAIGRQRRSRSPDQNDDSPEGSPDDGPR